MNKTYHKKELTWTTKEGKVLFIREMKTSHIRNCIRMLERAQLGIPDPYAWGEPEGDAAQDAFNAGVREIEMLDEKYEKKIKQFKRELKRRERVGWPILV